MSLWSGLAAHGRSEHADVPRAVTRRELENLPPM